MEPNTNYNPERTRSIYAKRCMRSPWDAGIGGISFSKILKLILQNQGTTDKDKTFALLYKQSNYCLTLLQN